jgi:hypothetical protein
MLMEWQRLPHPKICQECNYRGWMKSSGFQFWLRNIFALVILLLNSELICLGNFGKIIFFSILNSELACVGHVENPGVHMQTRVHFTQTVRSLHDVIWHGMGTNTDFCIETICGTQSLPMSKADLVGKTLQMRAFQRPSRRWKNVRTHFREQLLGFQLVRSFLSHLKARHLVQKSLLFYHWTIYWASSVQSSSLLLLWGPFLNSSWLGEDLNIEIVQ